MISYFEIFDVLRYLFNNAFKIMRFIDAMEFRIMLKSVNVIIL